MSENHPEISETKEIDTAGVRKSPILTSGNERFVETYTTGDFLDPKEYEREVDEIFKKRSQAYAEFEKNAILPDEKSLRTWNRERDKPRQVSKTGGSLIEKIDSNPEGKSIFAVELSRIVSLATSTLADNKIEELKKLAKKFDISYFYELPAQIDQFLLSGTQSIKIGGVPLRDFVNDPNLPLASIYRTAVEAYLVRYNMSHTKVLEEDQTPLTISYPNLTKEFIENATGQIAGLYYFTPEFFELLSRQFLPQQSSAEKEIIAKARGMIKKMSSVKQNIYNTILNPASTEFSPLKATLEEYLSKEDIRIKTLAILYLGLNTADKISTAYSNAKELAQDNNENSAFYTKLAATIRDLVEETPSTVNILTKDDLVSLLDTSISLDDSTVPAPEDLNIQTTVISQKALRPEYSIDPQNIDWKNLIPPTSAEIEFSQGGPSKFTIVLHYQNENGEILNLPVWFDTKKGDFDWSFMEAPDDPNMKDMRNTALLAAQAILSDVQKQAEAEYRQRQREREARTQTQQPSQGRKIRSDEPYIPREREERPERPRPLTPIQEVQEGQFTLPIRETVRKYILQPEDEGIRRMMEGISEENQTRIIEGINRFNERGTGKFKPLLTIEHDGKPVWELRVGDFRALVTRADPTSEATSNKRDRFVIYRIDDRKDIFKKKS